LRGILGVVIILFIRKVLTATLSLIIEIISELVAERVMLVLCVVCDPLTFLLWTLLLVSLSVTPLLYLLVFRSALSELSSYVVSVL